MNPKKLIHRRALVRWAIGLALLILAFVLSGPLPVFSAMGRGLGAFGTLIGLSAAALAFRACAWKMALAQEGRKNASLSAALIALTAVGGIPIRLGVLRKRTGIPDAAGSIVTDEAVRALAGVIFAVAGLFLGFLLVPGNILMRGLMLVAAIGGAVYFLVCTRRRKGFFTACLAAWPKRFVSPAVRGKMEERDRFLSKFRAENRGAFFTVLFIHLVVLLLFALQILVVGKTIDAYFPGVLSLGLAALIVLLRSAFSSLPAAFGVLEAGVALVLAMTFGVPLAAVGVAAVWVLRLLTLVWWVVGFAAAGNPVKILLGK
ncbi:MAG TPA: lysylphosphatidylglycerol synthase domain-containing protein [bacterium]|nr:lysylphosphatidylglycerol synthase domain-containing protein [bacterium]